MYPVEIPLRNWRRYYQAHGYFWTGNLMPNLYSCINCTLRLVRDAIRNISPSEGASPLYATIILKYLLSGGRRDDTGVRSRDCSTELGPPLSPSLISELKSWLKIRPYGEEVVNRACNSEKRRRRMRTLQCTIKELGSVPTRRRLSRLTAFVKNRRYKSRTWHTTRGGLKREKIVEMGIKVWG